jgi:hypothetical protein
MPSIDRLPAFALLLLLAALAAVFSGGQVAMCLGPLGVTVVECWAATGVPPRLAAAVAAAAALVAGATCLALRPATMSGPTSTGKVISINLPLEPALLATAAVAGAAAALAAAQRVRARLRPSAAGASCAIDCEGRRNEGRVMEVGRVLARYGASASDRRARGSSATSITRRAGPRALEHPRHREAVGLACAPGPPQWLRLVATCPRPGGSDTEGWHELDDRKRS